MKQSFGSIASAKQPQLKEKKMNTAPIHARPEDILLFWRDNDTDELYPQSLADHIEVGDLTAWDGKDVNVEFDHVEIHKISARPQ